MLQDNPFALFRAADYTDEQINLLWVELGSSAIINQIIEPKSVCSKFLLGGKGTGKTHLLRYYSYPVVRLRSQSESGISIIRKNKFLAVFLRATGVDAARFEATSELNSKWQQLFGIYLELRLAEGVLDALCDIKESSRGEDFNDVAFLDEINKSVLDESFSDCATVDDFKVWVIKQRRKIDDAVNNSAFSGALDLKAPFSIGALSLPISRAVRKWNPTFGGLPIIYLIDEIENFSFHQQQVVNSLIRYGEGLATFRVTGRRYAVKTHTTLADGEENRDGGEFKTTFLDDILLKEHARFSEFANKFVIKRLQSAGFALTANNDSKNEFHAKFCFEEVPVGNFYSSAIQTFRLSSAEAIYKKDFVDAFTSSPMDNAVDLSSRDLLEILTDQFPLLIQKLNILLFCKKIKKSKSAKTLAMKIRADAEDYVGPRTNKKGYYPTAYGHYASDLFAQLCRDSAVGSVPYAGFDNFVKMASGNPRNLLVVLGKAYEVAAFKGVDFITKDKLPIKMQTEAASEAARFMYEADTNFGSDSDLAKEAVVRLAVVLRTARYALNIPEVSPLAFSFSEHDLSVSARRVLHCALNYSLIFEISDGRPDRNSQKVNRKIQLNPLLSPKWGLPIARRGDISLNAALLSAIFDPDYSKDFDVMLKRLDAKWNSPFKSKDDWRQQGELF